MSELSFTPVDENTGVVCPVYVRPEDFTEHINRQHHKEHPSTRPELQDIYGRALRMSYTEQLPDQLHLSNYRLGYHKKLWGPETIPTNSLGKMTKTFLHLGRVVPREAIIITDSGYELTTLTDDEHSFLSHPAVTHIEGNREIQRQYRKAALGHAIVLYALLEQELVDIASTKVQNEFVRTLDRARERELGNLMIRRAIEESIQPALPVYERAKELGMVDKRSISMRSVVRALTSDFYISNYYEILRSRLTEPELGVVSALQTGVDTVQLAA